MNVRFLIVFIALLLASCFNELEAPGGGSPNGTGALTGVAGKYAGVSGASSTAGAAGSVSAAGSSAAGASAAGTSTNAGTGAESGIPTVGGTSSAGSPPVGGSTSPGGSAPLGGSSSQGGLLSVSGGTTATGGRPATCNATDACTPGTSIGCPCSSTFSSVQFCKDDCTYAACLCTTPGTGGSASASGGATSAGGSSSSGGNSSSTGGTSVTGGSASTGGAASVGGSQSTGGTSSPTGGTASTTGGSPSATGGCPPANSGSGATGGAGCICPANIPSGFVLIHLSYTATAVYDVIEIYGQAAAKDDPSFTALPRPWILDPASYSETSELLLPDNADAYEWGVLTDGVHGLCESRDHSGHVSCDVVVPADAALLLAPHFYNSGQDMLWGIESGRVIGIFAAYDARMTPIPSWDIEGSSANPSTVLRPGQFINLTTPAS